MKFDLSGLLNEDCKKRLSEEFENAVKNLMQHGINEYQLIIENWSEYITNEIINLYVEFRPVDKSLGFNVLEKVYKIWWRDKFTPCEIFHILVNKKSLKGDTDILEYIQNNKYSIDRLYIQYDSLSFGFEITIYR